MFLYSNFLIVILFESRAQGAIEYLLIVGAAILVVAVVIFALFSVVQMGQVQSDSKNVVRADYPIKQSLAEARGNVFLPQGFPVLVRYVGSQNITVGEPSFTCSY